MTYRDGAAVLLLLLTAVACSQDGRHAVTVEILQPGDGAVLSGPRVRVVLLAHGVEIAPASVEREGTAHHHLFVDRDLTELADTIPAGQTGIIHLGRGQTEFEIQDLTEGEHRIIAVLANWAHVPLSPLASDTVQVTMRL